MKKEMIKVLKLKEIESFEETLKMLEIESFRKSLKGLGTKYDLQRLIFNKFRFEFEMELESNYGDYNEFDYIDHITELYYLIVKNENYLLNNVGKADYSDLTDDKNIKDLVIKVFEKGFDKQLLVHAFNIRDKGLVFKDCSDCDEKGGGGIYDLAKNYFVDYILGDNVKVNFTEMIKNTCDTYLWDDIAVKDYSKAFFADYNPKDNFSDTKLRNKAYKHLEKTLTDIVFKEFKDLKKLSQKENINAL